MLSCSPPRIRRLVRFVNGACFLLAMAKILIVVRTLGLRLTSGTTFYIAAQLAFILGLPGLFHLLRSSTRDHLADADLRRVVDGRNFDRLRGVPGEKHLQPPRRWQHYPWRLYIVVPMISLLVHLCSENRVYWVHFQLANIAPGIAGVDLPC